MARLVGVQRRITGQKQARANNRHQNHKFLHYIFLLGLRRLKRHGFGKRCLGSKEGLEKKNPLVRNIFATPPRRSLNRAIISLLGSAPSPDRAPGSERMLEL
jgi:hypothetical protein